MDAASLQKLANGCVSKSDHAGAVKHLTDAIALSDTKELRANRAFSWTALDRNEEALADAKHCIAIAPTFSKGYLRAGRALLAMGQVEDAVALLELLRRHCLTTGGHHACSQNTSHCGSCQGLIIHRLFPLSVKSRCSPCPPSARCAKSSELVR